MDDDDNEELEEDEAIILDIFLPTPEAAELGWGNYPEQPGMLGTFLWDA